MSGDPIGEQRQHPLKIRRVGKPVVCPWENLQLLEARQGLEESPTLVEGNTFILITLNDQGWSDNGSSRLVGDSVEAVFVERKIEGKTSRTPMKIRDRAGLFPFL